MNHLRVWFWQRIVTPHMAELAAALARQGSEVTYVAEQSMSADRAEQGWMVPQLPGVRLEFAATAKSSATRVASAPPDSIHICQGLRGNGLVRHAQSAIKARGLRQWVVMETVDDAGWRGAIKRLEYRRLFAVWRQHLQGVLAIGHTTPAWVTARGMPADRVFPFAYFLGDLSLTTGLSPPRPLAGEGLGERAGNSTPAPLSLTLSPWTGGEGTEGLSEARTRFRFIFVGQFIERKRLDLLLDVLRRIPDQHFELAMIGSGPLEPSLRAMAAECLPGRVHWLGRLPLNQVPAEIAKADCLVLPSRHDGWGAVVSEALMVGTPVICSNACGSAGVACASGNGGVFNSGDRGELIEQLVRAVAGGLVQEPDRIALAHWATCLGAKAGAAYLANILHSVNSSGEKPAPPWSKAF